MVKITINSNWISLYALKYTWFYGSETIWKYFDSFIVAPHLEFGNMQGGRMEENAETKSLCYTRYKNAWYSSFTRKLFLAYSYFLAYFTTP
jgi:hypothetical protein